MSPPIWPLLWRIVAIPSDIGRNLLQVGARGRCWIETGAHWILIGTTRYGALSRRPRLVGLFGRQIESLADVLCLCKGLCLTFFAIFICCFAFWPSGFIDFASQSEIQFCFVVFIYVLSSTVNTMATPRLVLGVLFNPLNLMFKMIKEIDRKYALQVLCFVFFLFFFRCIQILQFKTFFIRERTLNVKSVFFF